MKFGAHVEQVKKIGPSKFSIVRLENKLLKENITLEWVVGKPISLTIDTVKCTRCILKAEDFLFESYQVMFINFNLINIYIKAKSFRT